MTNTPRHILLIYPQFPNTYWGMQYFLPLIGKKALMPPLGLIIVAAMTPDTYGIRLSDLNCEPLAQGDLDWADVVCFSAMLPQKPSLFQTAQRCRGAGKLIVFGGPYPSACPQECAPFCDVLVLNEGEITWPAFLKDLERGSYQSIYTTTERPDVTETPLPRFDLLKIQDYGAIPVQFSRGCPFQCEFCDIIVMFGRRPRIKTPAQVVAELTAVYETGYRGMIFIVDDNFIGNKKAVKKLLAALIEWNEVNRHPFFFGTEASVNLADDQELLDLMVRAHFLWVFLGIETPSPESLKETGKVQNLKGSLVDKVKAIQRAGLLVYGGFIIGFDHDTEDIFERQIDFITEAAIPNAMIGPLVALPGTPLYARMKQVGRLMAETDRDQERTVASGYTNIITRLSQRSLLEGQAKILQSLYTPAAYYARTFAALALLPRPRSLVKRIARVLWLAKAGASVLVDTQGPTAHGWIHSLGPLHRFLRQLPTDFKRESLKFAWRVLRHCPDQIPFVVPFILMGFHFFMFTFDHALPELSSSLRQHIDAGREKYRVAA
ncbi:MAG: radical SAM protein [Gammaproteobacteria bacterium]